MIQRRELGSDGVGCLLNGRVTLSPGLLEPMGRFIIDPVLRHRVRDRFPTRP
jgi:hypothetical protein